MSHIASGWWAIGPTLLSPFLSAAIYVVARRRLQDGADSTSRSHIFYRLISFLLLGQFLGHVRWTPSASATSQWLMPVLVAIGYFALDTIDSVARVWKVNPHVTAPPDGTVSDDIALDRTVGEDRDILVSSNITSPSFQNAVFAMQDLRTDIRKRRWILALLLVLFFVISFVDGLELLVVNASGVDQGVDQNEPALLYAFYYLHTLSLALAAYSAMIHARIQRIENIRHRLLIWALLTLCVTGIIATSAIMLLAWPQSGQTTPAQVLADPILVVFYGLAAGFLLRVQQYFHAVKREGLDRWDTLAGIVVAFVALAQAMATSVFF